jgi:hypothetical protein
MTYRRCLTLLDDKPRWACVALCKKAAVVQIRTTQDSNLFKVKSLIFQHAIYQDEFPFLNYNVIYNDFGRVWRQVRTKTRTIYNLGAVSKRIIKVDTTVVATRCLSIRSDRLIKAKAVPLHAMKALGGRGGIYSFLCCSHLGHGAEVAQSV